jgi:4-amino-4-deoxy-L-arabinose transferase-like glycosyltransferase
MKVGKKQVFWIIATILIITAVALTLEFTRFGPGASGDSVYYIMGAENIRRGNGFSRISGGGEIKPITGFPPFYPAVLSLFFSEGANQFTSAKLVNAVLFGCNVLLCLVMLYRYTRSILAATIGGLLLVSADTILLWHGWVMSEPLFVFLFLLAIYSFLEYFESRKVVWLIISGLAGGSAIITRYVGIALFPALALMALCFNHRTWKRRIWDSFLLTIFLLAPLLYLMLANTSDGGSGINRQITFHMMRPEIAWQYITEISSWFAPGNLPIDQIIRAVIALSIAFGIPVLFFKIFFREVTSFRIDQEKPYTILPWSLVVFIVAYLGVLLINSLFLDAGTTLSAVPRYLMPVYVAVILLFVSISFRLLTINPNKRVVRYSGILYAGVLVAASLLQTVELVNNPALYVGYSGIIISNSTLLEALKAVDQETIVISNNPEMVYFLMGRPAYMRPILFDHYSLQYRQDYQEQIEFTQSLLDQGAAYIQMRDPSQEEGDVIQELELVLTLAVDEATIYTSPNFQGSIFTDPDIK